MRAIDVTDRIRPLSVYPYENYSVVLKQTANLHYAYRMKRDLFEIEMSDYLEGAPDEVLNDECKVIVKWSMGERFSQAPSVEEYINSEEFIVGSRPKYLRRSRTFTMSEQGRCKNLLDSIERLLEMDLVHDTDIRNSYITWATHMAKNKFGQCNQTFRVISINPDLDSVDVPDELVDYVVYHEILHLRQDRTKKRRPHNAQFRGWEHMYPDYQAWDQYLSRFYRKHRHIGP